MYEGVSRITLHSFIVVIMIGIFNYLSQYLMFRSVQHINPSEGSLIHYYQVVQGYILGYIFLNESMNTLGILGMLMIIANGVLLFLKDHVFKKNL
jgi:drug/metabolite transporter (DMT)-like permease